MCTFINTLPKNYDSNGMPKKKKNLQVYIVPTEDKVYYRFRILSFAGIGTNRNYPFIQRYIHTHWGEDSEGKRRLEAQVVCPVTPWVVTSGNKYDSCPICKIANQHFVAFKESGWKSRTDAQKNRDLGRRFEAIIPVYVVNDPVYSGNNNKFRVIIFNDRNTYNQFLSKVEAFQSSGINVFNGENAVDCCIHMGLKDEVRNEGTPREYRYTVRAIDKIIFTNKPYTIEAITREAIDKFEFDETYYQASTSEEIDEFYKKYCVVQNDDIPEDDVLVFDAPKKKEQPKAMKNPEVVKNKIAEAPRQPTAPEVMRDEFQNDLTSDPDNVGLDITDDLLEDDSDVKTVSNIEDKIESSDSSNMPNDIDDANLDDLLNDLDENL